MRWHPNAVPPGIVVIGYSRYARTIDKLGDRRVPECPHYQMIEIAAAFAGIEFQPEQLCGLVEEHENTLGPLSGFRGEKYYPSAACNKTYNALAECLARFERVDQSGGQGALLEREAIITKWQETINALGLVSDQVDLDDEQIVNLVKAALEGLRRDVIGEEVIETLNHFGGTSWNYLIKPNRNAYHRCPIAPEYSEFGVHS
jgi:hypothetical protein